MSHSAGSAFPYTAPYITGLLAVGIPAALLLLVICVVRRHVNGATIASFEWRRSVHLRTQVWVTRTSQSRPPADARNVRSARERYLEWYSTIESRAHLSSRGGYEYRLEPVRRTRWAERTVYTYEVPQWRNGRTITASGADRDYVAWPAYTLAFNEQVWQQRERYAVVFTIPDGRRYRKKLAYQRWCALDQAAGYDLATTLTGHVTKIRQPARQN